MWIPGTHVKRAGRAKCRTSSPMLETDAASVRIAGPKQSSPDSQLWIQQGSLICENKVENNKVEYPPPLASMCSGCINACAHTHTHTVLYKITFRICLHKVDETVCLDIEFIPTYFIIDIQTFHSQDTFWS